MSRSGVFRIAAGLALISCVPTPQHTSTDASDNWYLLPYPTTVSRKLIQGNNGPFGHSGAAAFAFDFVMPIGSPVIAARDGEVVKVVKRFKDGTRVPGEENYIVIRHSDGTFGRYYHLTTNGALVDSGGRVRRGDVIGRSGNSGATAGPHLHFDVTRACFEWGCQTIPIKFRNAGADTLVAGKSYPLPAPSLLPSTAPDLPISTAAPNQARKVLTLKERGATLLPPQPLRARHTIPR